MRILIVEDEKNLAHSLHRGLKAEGFSVDIAYDGEEGVKKALAEDFKLILMDLMLPKKDGLSALRDLREYQLATPVICLSGCGTLDDIVSGLYGGADDYMVKPVDFSELVARCNAAIRRHALNRGADIIHDVLRLDPVSHKVWRNGQDIRLTRREFELMRYFMLHPNQVLTRAMIADDVWDDSFNSFSNIIDVFVNYLRNKVDKKFEKKFICTVRGQGYMLKIDSPD